MPGLESEPLAPSISYHGCRRLIANRHPSTEGLPWLSTIPIHQPWEESKRIRPYAIYLLSHLPFHPAGCTIPHLVAATEWPTSFVRFCLRHLSDYLGIRVVYPIQGAGPKHYWVDRVSWARVTRLTDPLPLRPLEPPPPTTKRMLATFDRDAQPQPETQP